MIASTQLQEAQQKMLGFAQQIAAQNGEKLDYSIQSIKAVDKIVRLIHKHEIKGKDITPDLEDGIHGIALALGCYIIEVIERHYGEGTWTRKVDADGHELLPYAYQEVEILPVGWCMYSLYHGNRANVQEQFGAFVQAIAEKNRKTAN